MSNWNISFNGKMYPAKWYDKSDGNIGVCSYDSETTMIEDQQVPIFILGMAYNGKTVYFIKKDNLKEFFDNHQKQEMYLAKGSFDLRVAQKAKAIENAITVILDKKLLGRDILILHKLAMLADDGSTPIPSLDRLSKLYLNVSLPKDVQDDEGNNVRTSFSRYLNKDGTISYDKMTHHYFWYAGIDAIATYDVAKLVMAQVYTQIEKHGVDRNLLLSHDLQLMSDICLDIISTNGMKVDLEHAKLSQEKLQADIATYLHALKEMGWEPGKKSTTRKQNILAGLGVKLPRTEAGRLQTKAEVLLPYKHIPFVDYLLKYNEAKKALDFFIVKGVVKEHFVKGIARPWYNVLVATGRTSSYGPNMQQIPKDDAVRNSFVARPGYCLASFDLSTIELRSLSQVNLRKFGYSKMGELINSGVDLHTFFASKILNCPESQVVKPARNKAKILNFGAGGGFGPASIVNMAKNEFETIMSLQEAKDLKELWLNTFPEMREYLKHTDIEDLIASGLMSTLKMKNGKYMDPKYAVFIFKGIINGQVSTKGGRTYTEEELDWAWSIVQNNFRMSKKQKENFEKAILTRTGSYKLYGDFAAQFTSIKYSSGRVRSNCIYTEAKNSLFQGTTADGFKWGLIYLTLAGYTIVNQIHDEYIIELPLSANLRVESEKIKALIIKGMQKVITDIKIEVGAEYMINWHKEGTHHLDKDGKLVPTKDLALKVGYNSGEDLLKALKGKWNDEKNTYQELLEVLQRDYGLSMDKDWVPLRESA